MSLLRVPRLLRLPRALWRTLRVLAQVASGWWTIVFLFPRLGPAEREQKVSDWARGMLRAMGIAIEVQGTPVAAGPVLLASNHISWPTSSSCMQRAFVASSPRPRYTTGR